MNERSQHLLPVKYCRIQELVWVKGCWQLLTKDVLCEICSVDPESKPMSIDNDRPSPRCVSVMRLGDRAIFVLHETFGRYFLDNSSLIIWAWLGAAYLNSLCSDYWRDVQNGDKEEGVLEALCPNGMKLF